MTKISLRRASKLRNKLNEVAQNIVTAQTQLIQVTVDVTDANIFAQLVEKETEFMKLYDRANKVNSALYSLRRSIGHANMISGVSDKLTFVSGANSQRENIRQVLRYATGSRLTQEQVEARVNLALHTLKEHGASYGSQVQKFTTLSKEVCDALKSAEMTLTREIDNASDELETLNNSTIELEDLVVEVLTAEGLM